VTFRASLTLLAVAVVAACGEPDQAPSAGSDGAEAVEGGGNFTPRVYERNFVFVSPEGDSVFFVPWFMQTVEESDSVMREARGWLARGEDWEGFFAERWWTPPTREPTRILPRGGLQLLVGEGDAIDGILFEEGRRTLEVIMGDAVASWTGARGGSFDVVRGSAFLADRRVDGLILEMTRASATDGPRGGDWAFLLSGDSAHFVLAADAEHGGEVEPVYRAWGDDASDDELQWPDVHIAWTRTEAFPPARRDVPVSWRVTSEDGELTGELEATSAELQSGEGPGPLLPVRGLFVVVGTLTTEDGRFPVQGLFVHERR